MSDRDETQAYLTAELDSLQQAQAIGDQAAVARRLKHVRDEGGQETAAVLEQMLKGAGSLRPPPTRPVLAPTAPSDGNQQLAPRSRKLPIVFLATAVVMLLVAVTVLVTVIILRSPATATVSPQPGPIGRPTDTTTPPSSTAAALCDV